MTPSDESYLDQLLSSVKDDNTGTTENSIWQKAKEKKAETDKEDDVVGKTTPSSSDEENPFADLTEGLDFYEPEDVQEEVTDNSSEDFSEDEGLSIDYDEPDNEAWNDDSAGNFDDKSETEEAFSELLGVPSDSESDSRENDDADAGLDFYLDSPLNNSDDGFVEMISEEKKDTKKSEKKAKKDSKLTKSKEKKSSKKKSPLKKSKKALKDEDKYESVYDEERRHVGGKAISFKDIDNDEEGPLSNYSIFDDFDESQVDDEINRELNAGMQKNPEEYTDFTHEDLQNKEQSEDPFEEKTYNPDLEPTPELDLEGIIPDNAFDPTAEAAQADTAQDNSGAESGETESGEEPVIDLFNNEDSSSEANPELASLDDLLTDVNATDENKSSFDDLGIDLDSLGVSGEDLDKLLESDNSEEGTNDQENAGKKKKEKVKDDRSWYAKLFTNVPIDPDKIKHEPTPEELEAKKQEKLEAKKAKKEAKKAAAAEKKEAALKAKEEKANLTKQQKEERRAKKLEEAKLILEEMEDTRINRAGAAVVFLFFGVIAIIVIVGSNVFTYASSVKSAEKSFNNAVNNANTAYYDDAYESIYGLDLNSGDSELGEKIMVSMFIKKEINSYTNYLKLGFDSLAIDSLFKGLYRCQQYADRASALGFLNDIDLLRKEILGILMNEYGVSEAEAYSIEYAYQQYYDETETFSEIQKKELKMNYTQSIYNIIERNSEN